MSTVIDIVLGAFLCVLLAVAVYLAVFRYRSASRKRSSKKGNGDKPAKEPAKSQEKHSGGPGSKGSLSLGKIVLWLAGILLFLLVLWYAIPILACIINLLLHTVFGDRIVQPARVPPQAVASERPLPSPTECARVEGERHTLTVTAGDKAQWIRVPAGGCITHFEVNDHKVVGAQCSSNSQTDEPSADASGEAYECRSNITTNWVRFVPPDCACDGPITVHYWFEAYKP